ncbi:hypothetical protein AB0I53_29985 [Saccharopolyspora sp. NPDC050389]|uniref:hypothetical protein n=1 Tax=Saccharopolyspora sp. NPDC050389 TaxID=3155516 RepID=UPI0033F99CD4
MTEADKQQRAITRKKGGRREDSPSPVWSLLSNAQQDWGTTCRSILLAVAPLVPVLLTVVLIHGSLSSITPWTAGIVAMLGMCRYAKARSSKNADPPNQQT